MARDRRLHSKAKRTCTGAIGAVGTKLTTKFWAAPGRMSTAEFGVPTTALVDVGGLEGEPSGQRAHEPGPAPGRRRRARVDDRGEGRRGRPDLDRAAARQHGGQQRRGRACRPGDEQQHRRGEECPGEEGHRGAHQDATTPALCAVATRSALALVSDDLGRRDSWWSRASRGPHRYARRPYNPAESEAHEDLVAAGSTAATNLSIGVLVAPAVGLRRRAIRTK